MTTHNVFIHNYYRFVLLKFGCFFVGSLFSALFAVFVNYEFSFHIDLVPVCNIVLTFTNGTDKCY
jgi:hypothetical protein